MDAARLVSPPRLSAARALVLLAAMAGLFAMHGLTDHGATHWGDHATMDAAMPLVAHAQPHEPVADEAQCRPWWWPPPRTSLAPTTAASLPTWG